MISPSNSGRASKTPVVTGRRFRKRRLSGVALALTLLVSLLAGSYPAPAGSNQPPFATGPAAIIEVFRIGPGLVARQRAIGVLTYRGKEYPIKVRGLSPSEFRRPVRLKLRNLTGLDELNGVFKPVNGRSSGDTQRCCLLRNERGVEIGLLQEGDRSAIRLDPNGVTIAVAREAVETRAPSYQGRLTSLLPRATGLGSRYLGPVLVTPTLNVQVAGFAEANNGWGGKFDEPLRESRFFFEQSNEEGLNASLNLGRYGILVGRLSAIFSMTGGGLDAEASNAGDLHPWDYALESGYLEWSSGPLFPVLGYDAITISGGPQAFSIGDGFLFSRGATNGGSRGANWLNPRVAFRETGVITLQTHDVLFQGFYLEPNDNPSTGTKLAGANLETPVGEYATTGFTYSNIFRSNDAREKGMNVFYWRGGATPILALPDLHLHTTFAAESNGGKVSGAAGWYVSPYYRFSQLSWRPTLYYRYASFSGGSQGRQAFDPLYYGSLDWGSWYQGEIVGTWVTTNSNLISHQVRLEVSPSPSTSVNLLIYKFLLYSRDQELVDEPIRPVTSKNFADEVDLTFEYAPAAWWLIGVTLAAAIPEQAAIQITGGTRTWVQSMLTTGVTF